MATSLAAQLKKLAVPETQNLLTGDFKQASFLYDDQEAATYTKQHFYNIGKFSYPVFEMIMIKVFCC